MKTINIIILLLISTVVYSQSVHPAFNVQWDSGIESLVYDAEWYEVNKVQINHNTVSLTLDENITVDGNDIYGNVYTFIYVNNKLVKITTKLRWEQKHAFVSTFSKGEGVTKNTSKGKEYSYMNDSTAVTLQVQDSIKSLYIIYEKNRK